VPPHKLHPGSTILLPSEEDLASSRALALRGDADRSDRRSLDEAPLPGGEHTVYTVKKGDTLYSIAREYLRDGSKWRLIAEANPDKVRGSSIAVGTRLRIPKN
jgi:nucleoid-associated protein YgaU